MCVCFLQCGLKRFDGKWCLRHSLQSDSRGLHDGVIAAVVSEWSSCWLCGKEQKLSRLWLGVQGLRYNCGLLPWDWVWRCYLCDVSFCGEKQNQKSPGLAWWCKSCSCFKNCCYCELRLYAWTDIGRLDTPESRLWFSRMCVLWCQDEYVIDTQVLQASIAGVSMKCFQACIYSYSALCACMRFASVCFCCCGNGIHVCMLVAWSCCLLGVWLVSSPRDTLTTMNLLCGAVICCEVFAVMSGAVLTFPERWLFMAMKLLVV